MIKICERQVELEFGEGDICIAGGYFKNKNNQRAGIVTFVNQEPRKIGEEGTIKAGQECKLEDFPVIMTFNKAESIDILIEQLEQAKNEMLEVVKEENEEMCGNPISDLWVNLKFTVEGSEYCRSIREDDKVLAFSQAICEKCADKNCKFSGICLELHDIRMYQDE